MRVVKAAEPFNRGTDRTGAATPHGQPGGCPPFQFKSFSLKYFVPEMSTFAMSPVPLI